MSKLEKFTKEYSIMGLVSQLKSGQLNRDAEMQRSYVWTNKEQTEYLDSVFQSANTYIPPLIGAESELEKEIKGKIEKIIDLLDGKQRSTTIEKFVNGEIKLGNNILPVIIEQEDGTEKTYIVAGKTWEELDEEVKTLFKANKIQMVFFKNMSYADRERQFIKLQGGKKLSNAEVNKVRIGQDMREFIYKQLATDLWTKHVKISNNRETKFEAVQQILMVLSGEYELSGKALQGFAENAEVSTEILKQAEAITEYLDTMAKTIKIASLPMELQGLTQEELTEQLSDKELKKYLKPIEYLKKVNVPIIYNVANIAIQNKVTHAEFAEFLNNFFEDVPFEYDRKTGNGSADFSAVKTRIESMEDVFAEQFGIETDREPELDQEEDQEQFEVA